MFFIGRLFLFGNFILFDLYLPTFCLTGGKLKSSVYIFFKTLGLGLVCNALGGILAGIVSQEELGPRRWEGVNQGAFFLVVDIGQIADLGTFRRQMDEFIEALRNMRPAPGYDRADAPGGPERERERAWTKEGIPVGPDHQKALEEVGKDLEMAMPW